MKDYSNNIYIASAVYALLFFIALLPGSLSFTTQRIGDQGDGWQNVWNLWWARHAIENGKSLYFTDMLHYPNGHTLLLHTLSPFNAVLSIPLQYVFDLNTVYNILVLLSYVMAGVGMWTLVYHLTKNQEASLLAGVIFAFSPFHVAHTLGHLQLISIQFIPLFFLFMIKTSEKASLSNIFLVTFFLVLNGLCSWYYYLFCLIGAIIHTIYTIVVGRDWPRFWALGMPLAFSMIILSPLHVDMLMESVKTEYGGQHNPIYYSADVGSFLVPGEVQSWGRYVDIRASGNASENGLFLGAAVIFLSFFAIKRKGYYSTYFLITAIVFYILSLGFYLHIFGTIYKIALPYFFLFLLFPPMRFMAMPVRFAGMGMFCLAVLAGMGADELYRSGRRKWVTYSIIVLFSFNLLYVPFPSSALPDSYLYGMMYDFRENCSAIDLRDKNHVLYYQTKHQVPLIGGYVSRWTAESEAFLNNTPGINTIIHGYPAVDNASDYLDSYKVCYILSYTNQTLSSAEQLNIGAVYDDGETRLYIRK